MIFTKKSKRWFYDPQLINTSLITLHSSLITHHSTAMSLEAYLKDISKIPLLSREEEEELFKKVKAFLTHTVQM